MNALIEFVGVNKTFGGRDIYQPDLSFTIQRFDKIGISGKSGAGKSSALNLLMGFIQPDKGQILRDSEKTSPQVLNNFRQKCVWIPQSFNFLEGLSVKQVILTPFEYAANIRMKPTNDKIIEFLTKVKLDERLLSSEISELSGGERQRVCAVIALLLDREIIILDEPTSNLDSEVSEDVINIFMNSDKTIIISTHDKTIYDKCNNLVELK
jgi:putative ABC transport system ATP-binding protein